MPQTFTDNQGNEWTLELTLGRARAIRGKLNLDLFNESDWQTLMSSLLDRLTYVFYLVSDQASERGVSIDDFDRALVGPGIPDQASDAFLDELVFFLSGARTDETRKANESISRRDNERETEIRGDRFRQNARANAQWVAVFAAASTVGLDWRDLTLSELEEVCRIRRVELWDHTTHISAHVMSCFTKRPISPGELNPYRKTTLKLDDPEAEYRRLVSESNN